MSVKITLEFDSVEESIVALGKLVGIKARGVKLASQDSAAPTGTDPAPTAQATGATPAAAEPVKPPRKPRADRGQPREPYGPRNPEANAAGAGAQTGNPGGAPADSPAVPAAAASAPQTAAPTQASTPAPEKTAPAAAAPVPSQEDVQKAVEKLFNAKGYDVTHDLLSRFGVKRGKDLAETQRADFIRRADGVIAGEAV